MRLPKVENGEIFYKTGTNSSVTAFKATSTKFCFEAFQCQKGSLTSGTCSITQLQYCPYNLYLVVFMTNEGRGQQFR